jgi:hypothetical protein
MSGGSAIMIVLSVYPITALKPERVVPPVGVHGLGLSVPRASV